MIFLTFLIITVTAKCTRGPEWDYQKISPNFLVLPQDETLFIDCSTNQKARIALMRENFNTIIARSSYGRNLTHNLVHMKLSDTGKYICTAETSCGKITRDIIVQVKGFDQYFI